MRTRTSAAMLIFRAGSGVTLAGRAEELKAARGGGGAKMREQNMHCIFLLSMSSMSNTSLFMKKMMLGRAGFRPWTFGSCANFFRGDGQGRC